MKVTIMLTWYSVMEPFSTRTCSSLIHALLMLRSVLFALPIPCLIASSKPLAEVALISETFAIGIWSSFVVGVREKGDVTEDEPEIVYLSIERSVHQEVDCRLRLVARHKALAEVAREIVVGGLRLGLENAADRIRKAVLHVEAGKCGEDAL